MSHRDRATEIFQAMASAGLEETEVFFKSGRSRRFDIDLQGRVGVSSSERGWAIRSGGPRSSMFIAGTGFPTADLGFPEPDGQPLRLPSAVVIPDWNPPVDLDLPLLGETESAAILDGIERSLGDELPGTRILRSFLEEGTSEASIVSTRGLDAHFRRRAATLFAEVVGPWPGSSSYQLSLAERDPRRFQPEAIARRLANRLLMVRGDGAPTAERGEMLLSSAVAARVLASLLPILLRPEGTEWARQARNRRGRMGSRHLTVIDDGRLQGGVLDSPVDGEGRPTGPRVLVEEGAFREGLVDWRQGGSSTMPPPGCIRRESWRDLPRVGPSHLYIQPRPDVGVGDLLGSISRGHYLVEPLGPGRFDFEQDRFSLPVCGFTLRQGAATAPVARAWLEGGIRALLEGIQGVARDLSFEPLGAMIGAPTLLVKGVGLRGAEPVGKD